MIEIIYSDIKYLPSYNSAVCAVSAEKKYLTTSLGFSLDESKSFQKLIIDNDFAQYFAIDNQTVVGWCDIIPKEEEFFKHVGVLGIGLLESYRGKGIGKKLLSACIEKAKQSGIVKIELEVFASNENAIKLYESFGFVFEGKKVKGKFFEGQYDDIVLMGKFI